jgi:hypothetical protein
MDTEAEAEAARAEPSPEERLERELIAKRREAAGSTRREFEGDLGLALSGGGIRSATFCLGLLRALAKAKSLRHVDYLSTVSGGGFVGAAYTRLYGAHSPQAVEAGLASDESVFLWWLRNNGRYLTPAGFKDVMQAVAYIFRGSLASHVEFAMIVASLFSVVLLADVVAQAAAGVDWVHRMREHHMSVWWWIAAASVFFIAHQIFAYWFRRSRDEDSVAYVDAIVVVLATVAAVCLIPFIAGLLQTNSPSWHGIGHIAAYVSLWAPLSAGLVRLRDESPLPEARLRHTKRLALALRVSMVMVLAGAIDVASYELAWLATHPKAGVAFPAVVAVFTAAAHWLQSRIAAAKEAARKAMRALGTWTVLNILGLVFLLLVVMGWAVLLQALVQSDFAWLPHKDPLPSAARWLAVFILPVAYVIGTLGGLETLNLSSLHNFYRARLERAYCSTGNAARFASRIFDRMQDGTVPAAQMRVARSIAGDDVDLADHQPHSNGGPIHLVNCCINQTLDDRTEAYNADRKGVALTLSALGVETGTRWPQGSVPKGDKLSKWIAISGAAASSGMGSQTTPGVAAFLFLSALRLGFWQAALGNRLDPNARAATRPELLLAECFARFPGLRSPQWYLSDGGHFENTAVYALLKRKVQLIVVADCGADPDYGFEDLENLVRKAAIDYAATIEFLSPPDATTKPDPDAQLRAAIGLPSRAKSDLAIVSRAGAPWLVLGRITYHDGTKGTLVVVKPRVTSCLTLDTANYAVSNASFPQQMTGDQFFDEAQWEAYHSLGVHLGRVLTPSNLAVLQSWVRAPQPNVCWAVRVPDAALAA